MVPEKTDQVQSSLADCVGHYLDPCNFHRFLVYSIYYWPPVAYARGGGGGQIFPPSPLTMVKLKTSLIETIRLFSYRVCRNCCHVFLCYPTCLLISRNFHCDAIIPVVQLFWWVALEPTTHAKCKPGQSQWVLLKP